MRKIALSPLLSLLMFSASFAFTQTTMTASSNFRCDGASAQPIQAFSQFECRGVPLYEGGVKVDSMFWLNNTALPEEWWLNGSSFSSSPYQGAIEQVTQFSLPNPSGYLNCGATSPLNGTVTFLVSFTDSYGVRHTGTFSGNWGETKVCGRYGWYTPVLKVGSTLTVN
jgi:hypothetical protein